MTDLRGCHRLAILLRPGRCDVDVRDRFFRQHRRHLRSPFTGDFANDQRVISTITMVVLLITAYGGGADVYAKCIMFCSAFWC